MLPCVWKSSFINLYLLQNKQNGNSQHAKWKFPTCDVSSQYNFFQTKQIIQWASSFKAKASCTNYLVAHNDDLGKNFNHWGWSHNNWKKIEGLKKSLQLKIEFNL